MAISKERNKNAVVNELKKNVKLIKNPNVRSRIERKLKEEHLKLVDKNTKRSSLQKLIEEDKEESEVEEESDVEESMKEENEYDEDGVGMEKEDD